MTLTNSIVGQCGNLTIYSIKHEGFYECINVILTLNSYTVGPYKNSGSRRLLSLENVWHRTFVYRVCNFVRNAWRLSYAKAVTCRSRTDWNKGELLYRPYNSVSTFISKAQGGCGTKGMVLIFCGVYSYLVCRVYNVMGVEWQVRPWLMLTSAKPSSPRHFIIRPS